MSMKRIYREAARALAQGEGQGEYSCWAISDQSGNGVEDWHKAPGVTAYLELYSSGADRHALLMQILNEPFETRQDLRVMLLLFAAEVLS
jgi:hypothetical protein